jgi:hypothetical protein
MCNTFSVALLSLLAGATASWVDWHSRPVQPTVLVILVATFFLGAIRPRHAWLCVLIVGGVVPCSYLGPAIWLHPLEMPQPNIWGSCLAFIPAAVGAAAGAACGTVVRTVSH